MEEPKSPSALTKIAFWIAIGMSCVCLALVASFAGALVVRVFYKEGVAFAEHGLSESAIVLVFALQPVVVLFLIARAIRLRRRGGALRTIAQALCPLFPVVLLPTWFPAISYLEAQSMQRSVRAQTMRWYTGRITYLCATHSPSADYNPRTARPTELRLTETRHLDRLGDWTVAWPGKAPIKAESFRARTSSMGGSQGIRWRAADGQKMVAFVSFSDLMDDLSPQTIWVEIVHSDTGKEKPVPFIISPDTYTCGPDPRTYDAGAR